MSLSRTCIGCGITDDHPRHVIALPDNTEVTWHMDCHARTTPCESCAHTVEIAAGATGDALREVLTTQRELTTQDG